MCKNLEGDANLHLIAHLVPESLFTSTKYTSFLQRLGVRGNVQHIVVNSERGGDAQPFRTPYLNAYKLCEADKVGGGDGDAVFVLPSGGGGVEADNVSSNNNLEGDKIADGKFLMEYNVVPLSKRGFVPPSIPAKKIGEEEQQLIRGECGSINATANSNNNSSNVSGGGEGEELIFLGTGSSVPCIHRNVSSIYVKMSNSNSIFLDVGEGTVGQLARCFQGEGVGTLTDRLRGVKAVYISHPHADHHLGLNQLLAERKRLLSDESEELQPLLIIAPGHVLSWLEGYGKNVCDEFCPWVGVDCARLHFKKTAADDDEAIDSARRKLADELGITDFVTTYVTHCYAAFGVAFTSETFGRVVYSGDCRPSNQLIEAARSSRSGNAIEVVDICIHEATFEDGLKVSER